MAIGGLGRNKRSLTHLCWRQSKEIVKTIANRMEDSEMVYVDACISILLMALT